MTDSVDPEGGPPQRSRLPDWAVVVIIAEGVAALIALITPLTPSKTGSMWTPAHIFSPDPTYLEMFGASFVAVNVLMLLLGLVAWISVRRGRSE